MTMLVQGFFSDITKTTDYKITCLHLQTCLKRIRLDMPLTHEDFIGKDGERLNTFTAPEYVQIKTEM